MYYGLFRVIHDDFRCEELICVSKDIEELKTLFKNEYKKYYDLLPYDISKEVETNHYIIRKCKICLKEIINGDNRKFGKTSRTKLP